LNRKLEGRSTEVVAGTKGWSVKPEIRQAPMMKVLTLAVPVVEKQ
jgi:hypothetical protein